VKNSPSPSFFLGPSIFQEFKFGVNFFSLFLIFELRDKKEKSLDFDNKKKKFWLIMILAIKNIVLDAYKFLKRIKKLNFHVVSPNNCFPGCFSVKKKCIFGLKKTLPFFSTNLGLPNTRDASNVSSVLLDKKIWLGGRKKLKWGGHKLEKSKPENKEYLPS